MRVIQVFACCAALLAAGPAVAQTLPAGTLSPSGTLTYPGPRYPGGPDSLRAQIARQLRGANPTWVGNVFVRLTLDTTGVVQKADYLTPPPGSPAAALVRNADAQALVTRVVQRLPRWQPGPKAPGAAYRAPETFTLLLPFGSPDAAPLAYSDDNPVFPVPDALRKRLRAANANLRYMLQMQFRYPADDLRANRQGEAFVYFEVSETGRIEQRQIAGSLSPTIDAEVLRVLQQLPDATTPPRQQGRPVRVYYVQPLNFKIQ